MDTTLFRKAQKGNLLIVQIYVGDIIFGATSKRMCKEIFVLMKGEFEMSMMGELKFFLGLQIIQKDDGTFIHQKKYKKDLLKRFEMDEARLIWLPLCILP